MVLVILKVFEDDVIKLLRGKIILDISRFRDRRTLKHNFFFQNKTAWSKIKV